jgi:hypothetical protein
MAQKEITWKIQLIAQKDITWKIQMMAEMLFAMSVHHAHFEKKIHHAHCEMKNGPKFKLT